MNFSQSLTYLNSFYDLEKTMTLPAGRRWKLERMRHLLRIFGQPQKSFLSVVIVGTKGKGSTGFFLQSILKEAGLSAGFYSSPHLESPRERIRIQGEIISKKLWCRLLETIHGTLARQKEKKAWGSYTYFEIMTLMAALAFKGAGVEAAVFEAGMGGRLDAVNALGAPVVIVTPIHLDHQEFLGPTVGHIAAEKAAVIHGRADVIMAPQKKAAEGVIRERAARQKARLWRVTQKVSYPVGLQGDHQQWNAAAAVLASKVLLQALNTRKLNEGRQDPSRSELKEPSLRRSISSSAVQAGLRAKNWPGRFETVSVRPRVILDGAHNPAAMEVLVKALKKVPEARDKRARILLFGVTRDKDSQTMLKILAQFFSTVILVPLLSSRGKSPAELHGEAQHFFSVQIPAQNLKEAVSLGKRLAGPNGLLAVTGSFYLAGAARALLCHERANR